MKHENRKPRPAAIFVYLPLLMTLLLATSPAVAGDQPELSESQEVSSTNEKSTATFDCNISQTDIAYCFYSGPVHNLYLNNNRMLLLYPDPSITTTVVQNAIDNVSYESYWSTTVTNHHALIIRAPASSTEASDPDGFHSQPD